MTSVYWVEHPNMGVRAVVYAPSTEKARTTFLDWLERTERIPRGDRHRWRRNMIAERLEYPEEVESDITLQYRYGYEEVAPGPAPSEVVPVEVTPKPEEALPMEASVAGEEPPLVVEEQQPRLSPIARASLGGHLR